MACITCGLCIDACNDTMDKIGRPRDLIGYLALTDEVREREGQTPKSVWVHVFRPRTILYTVLWAGVGIALVVALFLRSPIDINVSPVRNPTFVTLSDGSIRNTYDMRLRNKTGDAATFQILLTSDTRLNIALQGSETTEVTVPADQTFNQRVYVTAPAGTEAASAERTDLRLWVIEPGTTNRVWHDTIFFGKED
jgi:polyferredoxin